MSGIESESSSVDRIRCFDDLVFTGAIARVVKMDPNDQSSKENQGIVTYL